MQDKHFSFTILIADKRELRIHDRIKEFCVGRAIYVLNDWGSK
jgi:hypothetical protein